MFVEIGGLEVVWVVSGIVLLSLVVVPLELMLTGGGSE